MTSLPPALLALADGSIFKGVSIGAEGQTSGEVVFNTAMSGYQEILTEAALLERFTAVIERLGGTGQFQQGLYASSEMLVDGFLELYRSGILRRKVYQNAGVQRLLNDGLIGEEVTNETLEVLVKTGVISALLTSTICALNGLGYTSTTPLQTVAPAWQRINSEARSRAGLTLSAVMPRLKR